MPEKEIKKSGFEWLPLEERDIPALMAIAALAHPELPERGEVFAEKLTLFPEGCRKLCRSGDMLGYGICHPWGLNLIPPLDGFLRALPSPADCIYIHDVALLPGARGAGAAAAYEGQARALARRAGINSLALVAVYGTDKFWGRLGFAAAEGKAAPGGLNAYGAGAKYMVSRVP